jgi:dimethylaniline monooxygenase (N-oxide forming)
MLAYQGHGIPEWRNDAPHMHHFVNKSANALDLIDYDRLVPKGEVARCRGRRVTFIDGTEEDVDIVVLSTGYRPDFAFLPEAIRSQPLTEHFKSVFYNSDPTLAFAGFVRPVFGSIPIITEVQCRWIAQVFSGRHRLPDLESRIRQTREEAKSWRHFFKDTSGSKETLVDIFIYILGIARMTGEFPDRKRLLKEDPRLWLLSVIGPFNSVLMTLNDPERRAHAREMLEHHRFSHRSTAAALLVQAAARATRFDELLSVMEDAKYRVQTSDWAKKLDGKSATRATRWLLGWPKRALFVDSANYPWTRHRANTRSATAAPKSPNSTVSDSLGMRPVSMT